MFTKFTHSVVALAAITSLFACAGAEGADSEDDSNVSEDALTTYYARAVGTYEFKSATQADSFQRLVLKADRSFELDVDTGLRCVRAPCPSSQHLVGTYRVTSTNLYLDHNAERPSSNYYGVYPYSVRGDTVTLRRRGYVGWSTTMTKLPAALVPADVTKLAANASGGFVRPGPAGSECTLSLQQYSVDIATRRFSFTYCDGSVPNAPYRKISGSRTLTSADMNRLIAAYNQLKVTMNAPCGADLPYYTVDVTNPRGNKHYVDDFNSCQDPSLTYVDNIQAPFQVYRSLLPLRVSPQAVGEIANPVE